jgi:uncharacterized protein YlxP (DUF503 family)
MVVGVLQFTLQLYASQSEEDKEQIMRSLRGKIRKHFHLSVAELDEHLSWAEGAIGTAVVGAEEQPLEALTEQLIDFIERDGSIEVLDQRLDWVHLD